MRWTRYRNARRARLRVLTAKRVERQIARCRRLFGQGNPRAWILAMAGCEEMDWHGMARDRAAEYRAEFEARERERVAMEAACRCCPIHKAPTTQAPAANQGGGPP